MTKILMRGDLLPSNLQRECFARYVHRFTWEHVPAWSKKPIPNGNAYPVQFDSDAQRLARTLFPVIVREPARDTPLRLAHGDCCPFPYWSDGIPEGGTRETRVPVYRVMGASGNFLFRNIPWQSGGNGPEIVRKY